MQRVQLLSKRLRKNSNNFRYLRKSAAVLPVWCTQMPQKGLPVGRWRHEIGRDESRMEEGASRRRGRPKIQSPRKVSSGALARSAFERERTDNVMTELRAYKMMFRFLEDRYSRLPSDDLGGLLGELQLDRGDGKPFDSAIIKDWEKAVDAVNSEKVDPNVR